MVKLRRKGRCQERGVTANAMETALGEVLSQLSFMCKLDTPYQGKYKESEVEELKSTQDARRTVLAIPDPVTRLR
jgi:hypothetical protein